MLANIVDMSAYELPNILNNILSTEGEDLINIVLTKLRKGVKFTSAIFLDKILLSEEESIKSHPYQVNKIYRRWNTYHK